MATKRTDYRQMIKDRIPHTVNLALIWCKAKTNYVEHVYSQSIRFLRKDKLALRKQMYELFGKPGYYNQYEFDKTIMWDNLNEADTQYWEEVSKWVKFFETNSIPIQTIHKELTILKYSEQDIKERLCKTKFKDLPTYWQDKLYDFIKKNIIDG